MTKSETASLAYTVEKHRFYLAEFEQEAAWLSEKQKEGRRLASVKGIRYTFEPCEPEEWEYQLDFWEGESGGEGGRKFRQEEGWELAAKGSAWGLSFGKRDHAFAFTKAYFRRKSGSGEPFAPEVLFRIEQFERVIKSGIRRCKPFLLVILAYEFLIWGTGLPGINRVLSVVLTFAASALLLAVMYGFGIHIGQLDRLQKKREQYEKERECFGNQEDRF